MFREDRAVEILGRDRLLADTHGEGDVEGVEDGEVGQAARHRLNPEGGFFAATDKGEIGSRGQGGMEETGDGDDLGTGIGRRSRRCHRLPRRTGVADGEADVACTEETRGDMLNVDIERGLGAETDGEETVGDVLDDRGGTADTDDEDTLGGGEDIDGMGESGVVDRTAGAGDGFGSGVDDF